MKLKRILEEETELHDEADDAPTTNGKTHQRRPSLFTPRKSTSNHATINANFWNDNAALTQHMSDLKLELATIKNQNAQFAKLIEALTTKQRPSL